MDYFIVGDIHGTYNTLKKILKHWDPQNEQLIFVGDYINKGKHSKEVVQCVRELQRKYKNTVCIKGNHEYQMAQYIVNNTKKEDMKENYKNTLNHYDLKGKYRSDALWMHRLPLYFEDEHIYVSHAGVNFLGLRKFKENSMWSVLRYRGKLKRMKKLQIIGHTPVESGKPSYDSKQHVLNIDTGAGNFMNLTAVKIDKHGKIKRSYIEKVDKDDK